jgi:hypothetical protein
MNDLELETLEIILIEREFVCLCVYLLFSIMCITQGQGGWLWILYCKRRVCLFVQFKLQICLYLSLIKYTVHNKNERF